MVFGLSVWCAWLFWVLVYQYFALLGNIHLVLLREAGLCGWGGEMCRSSNYLHGVGGTQKPSCCGCRETISVIKYTLQKLSRFQSLEGLISRNDVLLLLLSGLAGV